QLVTYLPGGAEFGFLDGSFPTVNTKHPWNRGSRRWEGHGTLMVQRPGDDHAIWHLWAGPDRSFVCWYVNLQEAFRRTTIGYDTQDLELDIVVKSDGSWAFKDRELLDGHVARGRYTLEQIHSVIALGDDLARELDCGRRWWNDRWAEWIPDPDWRGAPLPDGWEHVPT